jgi:hypothetical protein
VSLVERKANAKAAQPGFDVHPSFFVKSVISEFLIQNTFDTTLSSLSIFFYPRSKSKLAAKMARKMFLATTQSWMKRFGSNFNHVRRKTTYTSKCVLYAIFFKIQDDRKNSWKTLLAIT